MYDILSIPERHIETGSYAVRQARLVYFGDCAGMYHPGDGAEAILILPPFGHEALASAKTLRLMAEALNARGFPVLRLDFPGTGDAPGEESSANALDSRQAGAIDAARWLRSETGARDVSVVGIRLGAAIALLAEKEIAPSRLLLAAPVLRGRNFLRELQQMQSFYASGPAASNNSAPNEYNGFTLSQGSVAALAKLDLRTSAAPAASVAMLSPAGGCGARALVETWRAHGADAQWIEYGAAETLLADPAVTAPEPALIAAVQRWFGHADCAAPPKFDAMHSALSTRAHYRESGCRFGEGQSLFGVMCRPALSDPDAPALVLVNTGGNSHQGWGRQTVELARRLAADGVATLRIDVAGTGESPDLPGRGARIVYDAQAAQDVAAAAKFLRHHGFCRPALVGICSGAFLAFNALSYTEGLSGALMINLQKFAWKDGDKLILYSSIGNYLARLFVPGSLMRILRGESDIGGVLKTVATRVLRLARARLCGLMGPNVRNNGQDTEPVSPRAVIERGLRGGVAITMAYTQGDGGIDEMRGEIGSRGRLVRNAGAFEFAMIRGADHNFSTAASREKLYPLVLDFAMKIAAARRARTAA